MWISDIMKAQYGFNIILRTIYGRQVNRNGKISVCEL